MRANEVAEITPLTRRHARAYVLELAGVTLGVLVTVVPELRLELQRIQMHLLFVTENPQDIVKKGTSRRIGRAKGLYLRLREFA